MGQLLSMQTALVHSLRVDGACSVMSAIHKRPVTGPVQVQAMGLAGDEQADLSVHGGLDKAVYAYPSEHYPFWAMARAQAGVARAQQPLPWGAMGENLSLQGLLESEVWVGDLLCFARCVLRVTQPRQPCYKFNAVMGFSGAARAMAQSGFCGFYLAVDQGGLLGTGENFDLVPGPRQVSIPEMFRFKAVRHLR